MDGYIMDGYETMFQDALRKLTTILSSRDRLGKNQNFNLNINRLHLNIIFYKKPISIVNLFVASKNVNIPLECNG